MANPTERDRQAALSLVLYGCYCNKEVFCFHHAQAAYAIAQAREEARREGYIAGIEAALACYLNQGDQEDMRALLTTTPPQQ